MEEEPFYFRAASYLYSLQSHSFYGFCVGRSDKFQALFGTGSNGLDIIWLNLEGDLIRVESLSWSDAGQTDLSDLDEAFEKAAKFIYEKYDLDDQTISIKRFWLPDLEAGIEDVTDNLKEFLSDKTSFDDDEAKDYEESLSEWKALEQFVFWWGQDFYVSVEGFVESS